VRQNTIQSAEENSKTNNTSEKQYSRFMNYEANADKAMIEIITSSGSE
jgi:hypothetical protein